MTITVTVDEMREYQKRCYAFAAYRAEFCATQLVLYKDSARDVRTVTPRPDAATKIAQWERENPFPMLLPPDL